MTKGRSPNNLNLWVMIPAGYLCEPAPTLSLKKYWTGLEKTTKNQSKLVITSSGQNILKTGLDRQSPHMLHENKL